MALVDAPLPFLPSRVVVIKEGRIHAQGTLDELQVTLVQLQVSPRLIPDTG
ncbi:hypothetical protein T484DRAFT_1798882 [Baffinella frigidus]|nr:hypothetical protein T484DRAFT_1798882 [Cryptophyta sp. CCMP2293]